jgi:hypothetical protein
MNHMPMSTRKATSSLQENDGGYARFLEGLELIAVGLKGCSAHLNRSGMARLSREERRSLRSFTEAYKVTEVGRGYFEACGSFIVTVRESAEAKPVLLVECEYEAHLHGPEPLSVAFIERFVGSEFQLILVPYARQFISSTTAQMSIPPVVIPLSTASPPKSSTRETVRTKRPTKSHGKAR